MPLFLTQVSYSEAGWQTLVSNPQNRAEAIRSVVENLGGRLINSYLSFGDFDVVLISDFPDTVSVAALAMAAAAGGAIKAVKTTPLMEVTEALEAMRKASAAGYRAPVSGKATSA